MIIKVGADPEVFVKQKGLFRSAHGLIPGTKQNPFPVEGGAVQVDGMALEFNIHPATSARGFSTNISTVMRQLEAMVPDYEIAITPVAKFSKKYLDLQPQEAKVLGCEPDFNAWTGEINPPPDADVNFRTAAGHVHIGWTQDEDITSTQHLHLCHTLVKHLDCYLGLPSRLFDPDEERRALYGRAGAFRPKSYGLEYRVLSNKWLEKTVLQEWVFRSVKNAIRSLKSGATPANGLNVEPVFNSGPQRQVREYINHLQRYRYDIEVPHV